ncbi:MAG: hypothetical protein ABSD03_15005 [Vulcanimicrobiaceae bacterium]
MDDAAAAFLVGADQVDLESGDGGLDAVSVDRVEVDHYVRLGISFLPEGHGNEDQRPVRSECGRPHSRGCR